MNNTTQKRNLVMEGNAGGLADALLAGAEGAEVLGGLGDDVGEELDNDAALKLAASADVQVAPRPNHRHRRRSRSEWGVERDENPKNDRRGFGHETAGPASGRGPTPPRRPGRQEVPLSPLVSVGPDFGVRFKS